MKRNIALTLMYDGTAYHGWQVQKRDVTVAETLEKALAQVVGHPVKCTGAGRTDAGVHAERYVSNFRTTSTIPCDRLPLAVNSRLPGDIVVTKATEVPEDFNAIGSCIKKEYTYRIYNSRIRNAFLVNRVWFYPKQLDADVMDRAAQHFVGTHDFASVRSVGTETKHDSPHRPLLRHRPRPQAAGDDRLPGVRRRVPVQHGPGHGGHLRLRLRGQDRPGRHPRPLRGPQPDRRRTDGAPPGAVHDQPLVSHPRLTLIFLIPSCRPMEVCV